MKTSWSASSTPEQKDEDLRALAGAWNATIQVAISNPATFSNGPIIRHYVTEEKHLFEIKKS